MANSIDASKRIIYAQQAFSALKNNLPFLDSVYRDYEDDARKKGETITVDVPSSFIAGTVSDGNDDNDYDTSSISVPLNNWNGVKASMTDKDLLEVNDNFIQNHLAPAADAVALKIAEDVTDLGSLVPWYNATTSDIVDDITEAEKDLFDRKVGPMGKSLLLNGTKYRDLLRDDAFNSVNKAGTDDALRRADIRDAFGFDIMRSQTIQDHTAGSLTIGSQLQLNAGVAKGDTTMVFKDSGGSLSGTVKKGDTFVIAGNTQRYAIAADATAGSNLITVTVSEGAAQAYSTSDNVTIRQEDKALNLAYHRTAFALVMRPLPEVPNSTVITDPNSGLSMRLQMWYDNDNVKHWFRVDALWGVKLLSGNRAQRIES
jgi:hypothetical protein